MRRVVAVTFRVTVRLSVFACPATPVSGRGRRSHHAMQPFIDNARDFGRCPEECARAAEGRSSDEAAVTAAGVVHGHHAGSAAFRSLRSLRGDT